MEHSWRTETFGFHPGRSSKCLTPTPVSSTTTSEFIVQCQLSSHLPASLLIWPEWPGQQRCTNQLIKVTDSTTNKEKGKVVSLLLSSLHLIFVCSQNSHTTNLITCQIRFRINYPPHPWSQLAHSHTIMQEPRKRNDRPCTERSDKSLSVHLSPLIVCFQRLLFSDQHITAVQLQPGKTKQAFKHRFWLTCGLLSAVKRCYAWSFCVCVQPK